MSTLESARRTRLHIIVPVFTLLCVGTTVVSAQDINEPGGGETWLHFLVPALLAFGICLPLGIRGALRGPMLEKNREERERRRSRGFYVGVFWFGIAYIFSLVFGEDLEALTSRVLIMGISTGGIIGLVAGLIAVWLPHHRRGEWAVDADPPRS